jgi:Ca2+-binding EF-hand superfamily protein
MTTHSMIRTLVVASALLLSTGSAISQTKPLDPKVAAEIDQKAKAADKNGDGKLTKAELEAGMPRIAKGFDMMDADKKGYVTVDQIKTFVAARQ